MPNEMLSVAKKNKADEFYTQLNVIEDELRYYTKHFKNKVVLCNCDDPFESNFFKYFAMNFNFLGLRKLIATCYTESPIAGEQLALNDIKTLVTKSIGKYAYKIEITEVKDENNDGAVDLSDVEFLLKNKSNILSLIEGNGDFRSIESIELLKESDIVVTNPPFSLFREFVAQLMDFNKSFIIIGNVNAITYRDIFRHIKSNNLWLGQSIHSGDREFRVPDSYPLDAANYRIDDDGKKFIRVKGVRWFTNLDIPGRHEKLTLYKSYKEEEYPKYYNYDAININKTSEIPEDYYGNMGVPITFLDKYNPDQFELIGLGISNSGLEIGVKPYTKKHREYRRDVQKRGAVNGDLYLIVGGVVNVPYARVIIRRK